MKYLRLSCTALVVMVAGCENSSPPNLADYPYQRNLVINQVLDTIQFTNTGGRAITSCRAEPALPAGIVIRSTSDRGSCELAGTPTASASRQVYVITARNSRGANTASITLTVFSELVSPVLANINAVQSYQVNQAIELLRFDNSGGESITQCSSMPALPSGLMLRPSTDNASCRLTGTPSQSVGQAVYAITATNRVGSSQGNVTITVGTNPTANTPPALVTPTIPDLIVGRMISEIVFDNNGGSPSATNGCSSSPTLPTGLTIGLSTNGRSCRITGTPTTAVAQRSYEITASNSNGAGTVMVSITVVEDSNRAPMLENQTVSNLTLNQNITPIVVTNTGGSPQSGGCRISPTLPNGLDIDLTADNSTCQITGSPQATVARRNYQVTATNTNGSSTADISIAVVSQ